MFTFPSVFFNPISLYLHRGEGGGGMIPMAMVSSM